MRTTASFSIALFLSASTLASADEMTAKVINVLDGNTVEVVTEKSEKLTVILADIDSPELTQEFGDKAKDFLRELALNKDVTVQLTGKDRKGNNLGIILIKGKTDARVALLQHGLAWTAEKNPNPDLEQHRTEAQTKGKGLWKHQNPTPPWTHRREQSMLQPKSS
jgi:micrococcal nuclease